MFFMWSASTHTHTRARACMSMYPLHNSCVNVLTDQATTDAVSLRIRGLPGEALRIPRPCGSLSGGGSPSYFVSEKRSPTQPQKNNTGCFPTAQGQLSGLTSGYRLPGPPVSIVILLTVFLFCLWPIPYSLRI